MRPLTPVEAAVGVAIAGSVLAAGIPAFVRNLQASRLVEPIDGLQRIAGRATALAGARQTSAAYPPSAALTPPRVPAAERALDPPGTWDHATWRELEFSFEVSHAFAFSFDSRNSPALSTFVARAHGDLDGDGALSTFEIAGNKREGGDAVTGHVEIHREVE